MGLEAWLCKQLVTNVLSPYLSFCLCCCLGLCDIDVTGEPLIQRLASYRCSATELSEKKLTSQMSPLPAAAPRRTLQESRRVSNFTSPLDNPVVYFPVGTCALAALAGHHATWTSEQLSLAKLTPEFFLCDLPPSLLLEPKRLKFEVSKKTLLGRGGAGAVYRATYDGKPVAMKQFSTTLVSYPETMSSDGVQRELVSAQDYLTSSFEELQAGDDAVSLLRQLRQEITVLQLLKHPCAVQLIGVQLHPIAFALELAPMGNLLELVETRIARQNKSTAGSSMQGPPLGHVLSQRVLIQVSTKVYQKLSVIG